MMMIVVIIILLLLPLSTSSVLRYRTVSSIRDTTRNILYSQQ